METTHYDPPLYLKYWPEYYKILSSHYVIRVNISKKPSISVEDNGDELVTKYVDYTISKSNKKDFEENSKDVLSRLLTLTQYD